MISLNNLPQELFRLIFEYLLIDDIMKLEETIENNQDLLSHFKSSLEGFTFKQQIRIINDSKSELLLNWIIDHQLLIETLQLYNILRDAKLNLLNHCRSSLKDI